MRSSPSPSAAARSYSGAVTEPEPRTPRIAVLVPVKAFDKAKSRLASHLDPAQRAELARAMATSVVAAAAPLPAFVVCDDQEVADWAAAVGARVLWRPGRGLNDAVRDGVAALAARNIERVVVAHSDLPLARSLAWTASFPGITLIPDRRAEGTNVVALPTDCGFQFAYGGNSFDRHCAEARRVGLALRVVHHAALGWDVDVPDDLASRTDNADAGAAQAADSGEHAKPLSSGP